MNMQPFQTIPNWLVRFVTSHDVWVDRVCIYWCVVTGRPLYLLHISKWKLQPPSTLYPLKFLNTNGCLGMHSKGNLWRGSFLSNLLIRSRASSGIPLGQRISTLEILWYVAWCESVSKGGLPTRNSYSNTPNAQTSTCSSCSRPSTISGGR